MDDLDQTSPVGAGSDESLDVWGYSDSGFYVTESGEVRFRGKRYEICEQAFPHFLSWGSQVLGAQVDPSDPCPSSYPPQVPSRRRCPEFEGDLEALIPGERRSTADTVRLRHGHGHTQAEMWAIKHAGLERVPDLVVFPESEKEVVELVALAAKYASRVCLVPFGGGTNVSQALLCPPSESRMIVSIDMRLMHRVLWVEPENGRACVEAGATGPEIDAQLRPHGMMMGHEPDSFEHSTLGGWIATHAGGMKQNRYGSIGDLVLGIHAVTPKGELERSQAPARESAGGDPARWLLSSEGRLGIVTSAVVKVFPRPETQRFGSLLFRDFESGVAFMHAVRRSGQIPASIRLLDHVQFELGQALRPVRRGFAKLRSDLEKFYVTRVRGFSEDRLAVCTLLFEGTADQVRAQERSTYALAARHGGLRAGSENGRRGYSLTFAIAYVRDFLNTQHIIAESFETNVPWDKVVSLTENVKRCVREEHTKRGLPGRPWIGVRVSQIYDTGVCAYFYFGFSHRGLESPMEAFAGLEKAARREILRSGGSISDHHGVGKLRQEFLGDVFSPTALELRKRLKDLIDPDNLLGCGN